jgi:hypothetical protein
MKIDAILTEHIKKAFAPLNSQAAAHGFAGPASLSTALDRANPSGAIHILPAVKTAPIAKMFTTAAVDMWLRAVHSFLISASLTNVSPIWASVTGYYSSHYAVRSIAHLLGYFQMFKKAKIVRLELQNGRFVCSITAKTRPEREHKFYWKIVKASPLFAADPFFTDNLGDESDSSHRDHANYADHLPAFPQFRPLDENDVRNRIERISDIEVRAPIIPNAKVYPAIESVQIIAYHRVVSYLIRFRELVDAVIGTQNNFWNVHRDPSWARAFMDFQVTEEPTLRSAFTL